MLCNGYHHELNYSMYRQSKEPVILNSIKEPGIKWGIQWEMKENIRMNEIAKTKYDSIQQLSMSNHNSKQWYLYFDLHQYHSIGNQRSL